mmetsp:Transcript_99243/g.155165  ORF Transcript_99243/g.155165 Transcript_99243/m.155165 type:complete len:200 (-) Transcript_99243:33-632(-)
MVCLRPKQLECLRTRWSWLPQHIWDARGSRNVARMDESKEWQETVPYANGRGHFRLFASRHGVVVGPCMEEDRIVVRQASFRVSSRFRRSLEKADRTRLSRSSSRDDAKARQNLHRSHSLEMRWRNWPRANLFFMACFVLTSMLEFAGILHAHFYFKLAVARCNVFLPCSDPVIKMGGACRALIIWLCISECFKFAVAR